MSTIPFQNCDITDPELLFGRNKVLESLCGHAEGLRQLQLIGARRIGKTCIIKCFITKQKEKSERRAYPIYLDLSSDVIKGTTNVYRYIVSQILFSLVIDKYINEPDLIVDEYTIRLFDDDWRKIYRQLCDINDLDTMTIFDRIVETWSGNLKQTFLLLFDEYEYMAKDAFDTKEGPRHLRTLSEKKSKPIILWLIGATPWGDFIDANKLDDVRISGVFNGVTRTKYVRPIDYHDFESMWRHECALIPNETDRISIESMCKKVFESSGGVPCFAKEIGVELYNEKQYPDYTLLEAHFKQLKKTLTKNEIDYLRDIQSSPKGYPYIPKSLKKLIDYGLIKKDDSERYFVSCGFLAEYINACILEDQMTLVSEDKSFRRIVNDIQDCIRLINEKWCNLNGLYMFDRSNDTDLYYRSMIEICDSRDKFTNCINSIYLLYWEGAKENGVSGAKIPDRFKYTMFRKSMDKIRHVFGKAHEPEKLITNYGQVDKVTALGEITGRTTDPLTPEDWCHFQECLLTRFLEELKELNESIDEVPHSRPNRRNNRRAGNRNIVVTGVYQVGTDGQNDVIIQNLSGYRHEVRSVRNGESLSDGDIVEYTLCSEPKPQSTSGKFWFAMDVHLKK